MPVFTKESLESLRQKIDLMEVLSSHVQFTGSGAFYKARCPFHEEKTPSFIIRKGDSHYHCFGCGAHGDAIHFLMNFQKMSFVESVEFLAQKFHVHLEYTEEKDLSLGFSKTVFKDVLEKAARFYHFLLLHTEEGHTALAYLYSRGIDIEFIKSFQIGFASKKNLLCKFMQTQKVENKWLEEVGLLRPGEKEFFYDRIMIPIRDPMGAVIGFTARKWKEETFGPKYVNTPETLLFKKSKVLFGLNYSRKRIAKERKALIVEGQIDALRLIHVGFTFTVAGQGTAFGEEHVKELIHLGVTEVFLAFDPDKAGQEAAMKVGNLFQKEAIEVKVLALPVGKDPDTMIREEGPMAFEKLLETGVDYLSFLFQKRSQEIDIRSPAGKNAVVLSITKQMQEWKEPLMIHESIRKLSEIAKVPQEMLRVDYKVHKEAPSQAPQISNVDPDKVLEMDILRWLFSLGDSLSLLVEMATVNLSADYFRVEGCKRLYQKYIDANLQKKGKDLLFFAMDDAEEQKILSEMFHKKINADKAKEALKESIQKMLDRHWMDQREKIRTRLQEKDCTEEEAVFLAKKFDELKKNRPEVVIPSPKTSS